MFKSATIFSSVMVGATMLSAIDAHAFWGGAFGHVTPVYRLPDPVIRPSFRASHHHARVIPDQPPSVNGYSGPNGPICRTFTSPPGACEVWAHGTPTGWHGYTCVVCD